MQIRLGVLAKLSQGRTHKNIRRSSCISSRSVFVIVALFSRLWLCACAQVELDTWLPKRPTAVCPEPPAGMTLPQLCELVTRKLALQEPEEVVRRAFRAFDDRAKGYISLADLESAVARVAPGLPRETVAHAFAELDADGDGRVAYGDFYGMFLARPGGRAAGVLPSPLQRAGVASAAAQARRAEAAVPLAV